MGSPAQGDVSTHFRQNTLDGGILSGPGGSPCCEGVLRSGVMPLMSSRGFAAALGPLIALVLIGGVIAAVVGGSDSGTDLAQQPADPAESEAPGADPTASPGTEASEATAEPTATAVAEPGPDSETGSTPDGEAEPIAGEQPLVPPGTGPTPMPEPSASPTSAPGDATPAVQDPTALTGGWAGGTPNTGTAVSAAGLVLLALGGGLVWLRRART